MPKLVSSPKLASSYEEPIGFYTDDDASLPPTWPGAMNDLAHYKNRAAGMPGSPSTPATAPSTYAPPSPRSPGQVERSAGPPPEYELDAGHTIITDNFPFKDLFAPDSGGYECTRGGRSMRAQPRDVRDERERYPEQYGSERYAPEEYVTERYAPERYARERYAPERYEAERYEAERFAAERFEAERFQNEPSSWPGCAPDAWGRDRLPEESASRVAKAHRVDERTEKLDKSRARAAKSDLVRERVRERKGARVCLRFLHGCCPRKQCKFAHVTTASLDEVEHAMRGFCPPTKYKTELCAFFPRGECTRGAMCTFVHQ